MKKEAHIAFFVPPAHGHINPTLGIVSDLVAKGYRVSYPTTERFAPALRNIGAAVVTYNQFFSWEGYSSEEEVLQIVNLVDRVARIHELLRVNEIFLKDTPDLIIYDYMSENGVLLAKTVPNVPSIKLFPGFAHNASFPFSVGGWRDNWPETARSSLDKDFALKGFGDYFVDHICEHNIVFIPKFFQCKGETFDKRFHFVGPSISNRAFYGEWLPSSQTKNLILISFGTVLNAQVSLFKTCMAAFMGLGMHVVISVGNGVDISLLEPIPSGFEVHQFVPHADILPHANVFIGHGGMNSTMEALYFGVPLLLAPPNGPQKLIAERVVELELGQILPTSNMTPEFLRNSLLSILQNNELIVRVKNAGCEMRKTNSVQQSVDLIEACLHR